MTRIHKATCDICNKETPWEDLYMGSVMNMKDKTSAGRDLCRDCGMKQIDHLGIKPSDWKAWKSQK